MDSNDVERMIKLFEISYLIAKEEFAFTKFEVLINIEKRHGVDLGNSYSNDKAVRVFIEHIAGAMLDDLKLVMQKSVYFSVLFDGSTDASDSEKELVYIITLDKGVPRPFFLGILEVDQASSDGILQSIDSAFNAINMADWKKHLVGAGADGASVNFGSNTGVITKIKENGAPWVVGVHCIAHRLELAASDALKVTSFKDVQDLMVRLYYFFKKSPKRWRELVKAGEALDQTLLKQSKVSGTRWLDHKLTALNVLERNYTALLTYFKDVVGRPGNTNVQNEAKYYIKTLENFQCQLLIAFFQDLLQPLKALSLNFQRSQASVLDILDNVEATCTALELLKNHDGPKLKGIMKSASKATKNAQNIDIVILDEHQIKNVHSAIEFFQKSRTEIVSKLVKCINTRFENCKSPIFLAPKVFKTSTWPSDELLPLFGNDEILLLSEHFLQLLQANGCQTDMIHQEWLSLKLYISKYYHNLKFQDIWEKILIQSEQEQLPQFANILHLVRVVMVYPLSTSQVERGFSCSKRILGDWRCSLNVNTLQDLMRICVDGPGIEDFDVRCAVTRWFNSGKRSRRIKIQPYGKRLPNTPTEEIESESD